MKKSPVSLLFAGLALASPLQAAVIAADNFDSYMAGALNGQNGTTDGTWSGAWAAQPAATVTSSGFSGFGNALSGGPPDNGSLVKRSFAAQQQTFYIGFTFVTTAIDSGDFIQFGSADTAGLSVNNLSAIWRPINAGGKFEARSATTSVNGPTDKTANTVYQVVLKLGYNSTSSTFDTASVFIDKSTETGADVISNVDSTLASLTYFGIRTSSLDDGDTFMIDNLKIATTYAEAFTAVPEPTSAGLLALGGLAAAARRRRERQ